MILYASATACRRNRVELHVHGYRMLVTPGRTREAHLGPGFGYALDNGAWTSHTQGVAWDPGLFRACVERLGGCADFVIAPDVVGGGLASLRMSESWLAWLAPRTRRVLVAVQDGVEQTDVRALVDVGVGIAIGGSTAWKERACARRMFESPILHVLRVNTQRRLELARHAGATSCDGSGPSKWSAVADRLPRALKQGALWAV